jgi:hypothetical protein
MKGTMAKASEYPASLSFIPLCWLVSFVLITIGVSLEKFSLSNVTAGVIGAGTLSLVRQLKALISNTCRQTGIGLLA